MRPCSLCKTLYTESDFHTVKRKTGKLYTYTYCKPCHRQYMKDHYSRNKDAYLQKARERKARLLPALRVQLVEFFKTNPCVDCGETDVRVLQFDHKDGVDKKDNVSAMLMHCLPWAKILEEISKCEVRCANCHLRRTGRQFAWWSASLPS